MDDMSIDAVILEICNNLYGWSSDIRIAMIHETRYDDHNINGIGYTCSIVLVKGSFLMDITSMPEIEEWCVKLVVESANDQTLDGAKRLLLDKLLKRCKTALEVPITKVMNS